MGQQCAKISVWSSIVEKTFFCPPPLPPLCDPNFYPSPRAILKGTSLFEAFSPPSGKESVPMCGYKANFRKPKKKKRRKPWWWWWSVNGVALS